MRIRFNGDGGDFKGPNALDVSIVHIDSPIQDFTLCGLTLDCDPGTCGTFSIVKSKATCSQCLAIVSHCRSVRIR
jgi:hypothetical protein